MDYRMLLSSLILGGAAYAAPPLVYDTEDPQSRFAGIIDIDTCRYDMHLPDPLLLADGTRVADDAGWQRRRAEIIDLLYACEIGPKPATPADSITACMDADTLCVTVRGAGHALTLRATITYPEGEGPFPAVIGIGMPAGSLPKEMFLRRGIACIAYNFTQVMSHTQVRGTEPINRIYPDLEYIGAYSAWPWGVSRLIDGLEIVPGHARIDLGHLAVTGCSFAGKMALFSGALDQRIALTIAQEPGGGGVAAWRVSEGLGNVETIGRTNYSWFMEDMRRFAGPNVNRLPIDHHELTALIAPRALLVLGNTDYEWLADESMYVSCRAAKKVWEALGVPERMGYSIEGDHPHCMLPPSQRPEVEAFIDRYLLGKEVPTDVGRADMFADTDWQKWIPWAE